MEFKCDRDVALIGLGPALASALDKMTRYVGVPARWTGWDQWLLTHPSLQDRVTALAVAAPAREPASPFYTPSEPDDEK